MVCDLAQPEQTQAIRSAIGQKRRNRGGTGDIGMWERLHTTLASSRLEIRTERKYGGARWLVLCMTASGMRRQVTWRGSVDRLMCRQPALLLLPILSLLGPSSARAQETVSDVVGFLMTNQGVLTADFERDRAAAQAASDALVRALLVNLTTVPIATSSSGFLYRFNPELGTVERATDGFGGFFVERALTPGHGRASFGISASSSAFNRLDGQSLDDGRFVTTANRFADEPESFDTDRLTLRVRSSTVTAFASVGITDRLEIGGAVPFVELMLEGERVNVYRGQTGLQASGTATARGMADAAVRAKYTVVSGGRGAAAIAAELRLPTGDAENLLGAGSAGFRLMGIGALERGSIMVSGNAALVRGGLSDEVTFGGAAALALHPRVSVTTEVLARHIAELRPLELWAQPHPTYQGVQTVRLRGGEPGRTVAAGIAGVKWNPAGTLVLGAHLRWNFTDTGLTAPLTPALAFEYGF